MKVLKERIEEISTLITQVATGNFDYQLEVSETGDELDALISGVSMLGQELKKSTVSRDFMQSIYQGVVDMLLVLNTDFTVRNVNAALEELLGFNEAELTGLHLSALVQHQDNESFHSLPDQFQEQGQCLNVELLFSTRREDKIPASCSFSYLRNNAKEVDGILIIARDITQRKQNERELQEAKEKAEAANEAKSTFLSSMSHEIRTPLNGIMGFTDLLLETEKSPIQAQYINYIKTAGSTLTKLLNDILDLNRIEQDKMSLEMLPFDIRHAITSNLEPYKYLAVNKGLAFSYDFDGSVPQMAIGDASRINQVLVNLVSNAIKFTAGGSIEVRFEAKQAGDTLQFTCSVTDTGIGIPPEKQALVFDSFTQSDQSTSRKFGGFGLGLAISKKLVQLMEGDMGLISPLPNQDLGAKFWFNVPLQLAENKPAADLSLLSADYQLRDGFQVLVVDDNAMNVILMQKVFKSLGTRITSAKNGKEALALAAAQPFDLVFMDIQMPEMDGLEASYLLRKSHFKAPIIAFSANAYKEDIQQSLDAGMNDHLSKPFSRQDLIAVLVKWAR